MPFNRPSLTDLTSGIKSDIEQRLDPDSSPLRRATTTALAYALGGAAHGLYGFMDWMSLQILPDTAEDEMLDRHAAIRGLTRKAAISAAGDVDFTGTDGAVIPAGTILTRADGLEFETAAEGTIAAGVATIAVAAVDPAAEGITEAGELLAFVSPLADVDSVATVAAGGLTGGADVETNDQLRARILLRWRKPPQGGAAHDYIAWALEIEGVTRAWVLRETGGEVTVRYVMDDELDIFPDAAHVAVVQTYIEDLRPITAEVTVAAPVAVDLDFAIQISPNTTAVQSAVTAELNDLLTREAAPGATIYLSKIREAVSIAAGEGNNVVVAPATDVTHLSGEMARLGAITFSEVA